MNGDVGRWVLEFLLRNPQVPTNLLKKVLLRIPLSNVDSRLKKTLLLKTLQVHLHNVSIAEPILKTLEELEELHRLDDSPITSTMSAAYCAVAAECTLKYLQVELHNNPVYRTAVNRIWRGRVRHMNGSGSRERSLLLSPELEQWRSDIEASLSDLQVRERLASVDARRDAITKLRAYVTEAWANLGPSFLEVAASLHINKPVAMNHSEAQHQDTETQKCVAAEEVKEETHVEKQSRNANVPCPEADQMEKDQNSVRRDCAHRPSLMERNSTACTHEWDDSIDGWEGGTSNHASRFHLPSPKRRQLSPLKKYNPGPASIAKRRKSKKWSRLEEETLKTAVDKFGKGNWKLILDAHKDIFEERTEVDLKDKWRNLMQYGCK